MSVLRRAKLRTPDGTESIEYPLGVDAENVEVANGENLSQRLARIDEDLEKNEEDITAVSELVGINKQNIGANEIRIDALEKRSASVDKKPYYFNTVADMKAYQKLIEGDMAITLGYYEANDGGEALYKIRNITNNDVIDNAIIISLNSNNLIAELMTNNIVNVKQFGAYGDNIHNDTNAFKKAINYAYNLTNANFYNSFKIIIPKGKYLITEELRFESSTLSSSEFSNIIVEGEGQGSTVILSNFADNKNLFYINASSKFSLKNISFKNLDDNANVTAVKIDGSSMLIDLTNLFAYNFYIGFDTDICVGNITNCFANSCNCGFKTHGTSTNILNCYASQCIKKNEINEYEGCGYYIDSIYSVLQACASDSNFKAYKIVKNGVSLVNCGMEWDNCGIEIETPNSNLYQAPIVIDGYTFDNVNKPTISIKKAQKVIIKNHNFSLDYDYVDVSNNLPTNVVEFSNCNFYVVNSTLYPSNILIPLDNVGRTRGLIYNFDGYRNEGKARIYSRSIKWRISKTNNNKLVNGRQVALKINAFTIQQYQDSTITSFNEDLLINYYVSGSYLAKSVANYDNTKFTLTRSSDDNYWYYELTPVDNSIVPDNNILCYDIRILDNTVFNLNNGLNLIEFEGLDY